LEAGVSGSCGLNACAAAASWDRPLAVICAEPQGFAYHPPPSRDYL
jgi:hypothetical protein